MANTFILSHFRSYSLSLLLSLSSVPLFFSFSLLVNNKIKRTPPQQHNNWENTLCRMTQHTHIEHFQIKWKMPDREHPSVFPATHLAIQQISLRAFFFTPFGILFLANLWLTLRFVLFRWHFSVLT